MHDIKQHNEILSNDIHNKKFLSCTPSTTKKSESNDITNSIKPLSFETVTKNQANIAYQHENSAGAKSRFCSSSTDSGVNICDTDESLSFSSTPSHLHSNSSSISLNEKHKAASSCYNQFSKSNGNTNQDNNVNNYKGNECKIINSNNKHFIINGDNHVENDDENGDNNSQKIDNNFKVVNSSNGDNYSRYQPNQNIIESKNVINISQRQNLTTVISGETPTLALPATNNEKPSLEHNEFLTLQQRPANSDDNNQPSNMFHCSESPVVSIRSINSEIITSDSDSDSDLNNGYEDGRENYVIKKLGTQVTYTPNDPNIPKINSSHTVLNQKVITDKYDEPLSPLAALAAIGDNIGAAQGLGPLSSSVAQRPQIGSIALNNSSDVTFGDKHFYEGPVTIQQFLIDSHIKRKETTEKDDLTFEKETNEQFAKESKTLNSSEEKSSGLSEYILKRKNVIIPSGLAFMALLIVATILGSKMLNDGKSKLLVENNEESRNVVPINSTIAQDNVGGGYVLRIVPRVGWLAQPPVNPLVKLNTPIERVIVIPTRTSECETQAACTYTVRITQTYNIESQQQDDIIYNFLIGGDGNVYEGRGWDKRGSVIKGYNDDSISFAYIGSFKRQSPSYKQLNVTKLLLQEGVRLKMLSSGYKIVGANRLDPTSVATIADALYKSFENWPHWSDK